MRHLFLLMISALVLSGCTWVDLTPAGETVELMQATDVTNCRRMGRVTARSQDEIVRIDRSSEKLQNELLVLARNEAGAMGGNAIVPESVIIEGSQIFAVYDCP